MEKQSYLRRVYNALPDFLKAKSPPVLSEAQTKKALPTTGTPSSKPTGINSSSSVSDRYETARKIYNRKDVDCIRYLSRYEPDFSFGLNTVVALANTGWRLDFDSKVKAEEADAMREHIRIKMKEWASDNFTSPSGLVDKMFKQVMIGGAIANEWVPSPELDTISKVAFIKPEAVEFIYDHRALKYLQFQRTTGILDNKVSPVGDPSLIPLNPLTFKYLGIPTDDDTPYGIPPFLTALDPKELDDIMMENIGTIVKSMGLWGFLEVLLNKPDQIGGEGDAAYISRLEGQLGKAKERMKSGYHDGIAVGYKDDVEFKFNSGAKEGKGAKEIFAINWDRKVRGLKSDPTLFGGSDSRTETQIAIIFTKMLSELTSHQNLVKENLQFGIERELLLRGFRFSKVKIKFNPSTLQDALKHEQAVEVKIRNNHALYWDGIISQDNYAEALGYDTPHLPKPLVNRSASSNSKDAEKEQKRESDKDKSDRDTRKKNKPQDT